MKKGYQHLIGIFDASGSMAHLHGDTIKGVNELLRKQKDLPGDFTSALYTFNTTHRAIEEKELTPSNYVTWGGTALLDAVCYIIDAEGNRLANMKESERPDQVVVLIVTDGEENSSRIRNIDDLKKRVAEQETKYAWQFIFMGANIDAFRTGQSYGLNVQGLWQWTPTVVGVNYAYAVAAKSVSDFKLGTVTSTNMAAAASALAKEGITDPDAPQTTA